MWVSLVIVSKKNLNAKRRKGLRKGREGQLEFINYASDPIFHVNYVKVQHERETAHTPGTPHKQTPATQARGQNALS